MISITITIVIALLQLPILHLTNGSTSNSTSASITSRSASDITNIITFSCASSITLIRMLDRLVCLKFFNLQFLRELAIIDGSISCAGYIGYNTHPKEFFSCDDRLFVKFSDPVLSRKENCCRNSYY